jgi:hypothetical protein
MAFVFQSVPGVPQNTGQCDACGTTCLDKSHHRMFAGKFAGYQKMILTPPLISDTLILAGEFAGS